LTDLVAAQDDLMTEINERFARVVEVCMADMQKQYSDLPGCWSPMNLTYPWRVLSQTDGKRSKNEQLIDLLNELDPVASAVAPELSVRFKFFEDMAQSRRAGTDTSQVRLPWGVAAESQAGSSTASNTAEVQRASDGTIVTSQQHSAKQSPPGFSIKFGGDQITVQSPRAMVSTGNDESHCRPIILVCSHLQSRKLCVPLEISARVMQFQISFFVPGCFRVYSIYVLHSTLFIRSSY